MPAPRLVLPAAPSRSRPFYQLQRIRIADTNPTEFVWQVRDETQTKDPALLPPGEVFKSFTSPQLREWVSRLPAGSSILSFFFLGPIRSNADMLLPPALQSDLNDFQQYCNNKHVNLSYVINGG